MTLLLAESETTILYYFFGLIISIIIIYFVIKLAVKSAIIETRKPTILKSQVITEKPMTIENKTLQQKYDAGEISFDEYKKEWDKL